VILDFVLLRSSHSEYATRIFELHENGEIDVFVASISIINVFYTTRKEKDVDTAHQAVGLLLNAVGVCGANKDLLSNAYDLGFLDYEDAVQCASAVAEGLDAIVTRNTKDFERSSIPVYSPAQFLEILQQSSG
jgi:predicted nucleic acid-binding protein